MSLERKKLNIKNNTCGIHGAISILILTNHRQSKMRQTSLQDYPTNIIHMVRVYNLKETLTIVEDQKQVYHKYQYYRRNCSFQLRQNFNEAVLNRGQSPIQIQSKRTITQAKMYAKEKRSQQCFERETDGPKIHNPSDNQATLKSHTCESKLINVCIQYLRVFA